MNLKKWQKTLSGEKNMKKQWKIEPIRGQKNDAQEPSNLADQWSRSDRHIAIDSGRRN